MSRATGGMKERLWTIAMLLLVSFAGHGEIKDDEEVVFFPTSAWREGGHWQVPVHGWIFEPEVDSLWRAAFVAGLRELIDLDDPVREGLFRERLRLFLVDNERGKVVRLSVAGHTRDSTASGPDGHFQARLRLPATAVPVAGTVEVSTLASGREARLFRGRVQLVPETGLSVISDIDDTVKISQVLDRRALMANTFARPFRAVEGMPALYRQWQARGAVFHYVSSSPWQLYPPLQEFFVEAGLPGGSFHLKSFRFKDRTALDMFASSLETKPPVIRALLRRYPGRRFILVGDSGEHDPEIYAAMAREFPTQIEAIYIRAVPGSDVGAARMRAAFDGIPTVRWQVFADARQLARQLFAATP